MILHESLEQLTQSEKKSKLITYADNAKQRKQKIKVLEVHEDNYLSCSELELFKQLLGEDSFW